MRQVPRLRGEAIKHHNECARGLSRELDVTMCELVGGRSIDILRKMQGAVLSGTLNIARTFTVVV